MFEALLRKQKPGEPPSQLIKGKMLRGFVRNFCYICVHTKFHSKIYPLYKLAIGCDQNLCESSANVLLQFTINVNSEQRK